MKSSWLKYLGFLGFLGLLGILTSNVGFLGFLGFFAFFAHAKSIQDERLEANINRAARNSFVASVVFFAVGIVVAVVTSDLSLFIYAFPANFALLLVTFSFSLQYYERKGKD
jgi:hypothetical protein